MTDAARPLSGRPHPDAVDLKAAPSANWQNALAWAAGVLARANVPDPGRDARLCARWASGLSAAGLAAADRDPPGAALASFHAAISARAKRQPLSQIVGERLFWGRSFAVTADVLDPRPETETLIAAALERPARRILDLGTGSGCLLLTLLAEWPDAHGTGTDRSAAALAVARRTAAALGVADRASFALGDWFDPVGGRFDLILCNPPYVSGAEMADLAPELAWEPASALTPDLTPEGHPDQAGDGLAAYRAILPQATSYLAPGGRLILELGRGQAAAVGAIAAAAGLVVEATRPDFLGILRAMLLASARPADGTE
ncbi:MAG: peptide chain release factor N(5)-glutamine methyltransferase [Paracoccaceae bacterium]